MERVALFPNSVSRRHLVELTTELDWFERRLTEHERTA